jgi:hypothetical protein
VRFNVLPRLAQKPPAFVDFLHPVVYLRPSLVELPLV